MLWLGAAGAGQAPQGARDLFVTVGKSLVVESPVNIQRVSVGDARVAEAVAVTPREVLVNGKQVGETSLIIWQAGGNRLLFDLRVRPNTATLEAVRAELAKELPGQDVTVAVQGEHVFLRGTTSTLGAAERAATIAGTLGKVVNLLRVKTPAAEDQILLKVRFADVDRTATRDLGINLFSTGAGNTPGSISTQQFSPPTGTLAGKGANFTLQDALNIFLFRPDLNLGATIRALESRSVLQILAEPNLLTLNGRPASFLAGGEFPVPVVQSGVGGAGALSIQWREFGVRINFLPTVTARGTIRLRVVPEVSSLDQAHGVVISGFQVPAISTRRVQTEVELQDGQSFVIGGLLDNRVIDSWNKIPGLGDIPLIGKLFRSRNVNKTNSELLVLVTPEVVRPIPAGQPRPDVHPVYPYLEDAPKEAPRTPPLSVTGPATAGGKESVPVEELQAEQQPGQPQGQSAPATQAPMQFQLVPVPAQPTPGAAPTGPAQTPTPTNVQNP
jgi:pilus assembly protein CpaC